MLEHYFRPQTVDRFMASWIGPAIEEYVGWLTREGYGQRVVLRRVPLLMHFGEFARSRGATTVADLPRLAGPFVASWIKRHAQRCRSKRSLDLVRTEAHAPVHQLLRVVLPDLAAAEKLAASARPWPLEDRVHGFGEYLTRERGLSPETLREYRYHLLRLERFLRRRKVTRLSQLSPLLVSGFMTEGAGRLSIGTLRRRCGTLRVFLRYLHREGICSADLSGVVEWPRSYRLAEIPRSISSDEVRRVLSAVDRRTQVGKRDYAMLLLLVTYGLRAREVAALTFDDLDWEHDRLRVPKRKAGHSTVFPLSAVVGAALVDYIRDGRVHSPARFVFLDLLPPFRPVRHHLVSHRAATALRRAGVNVRRPGSHTFRHTCVQRLVDARFPFKVIGDYVGHRSPDTTRIYGKVDIESLREVAMGDGEEVL
jgi:integrase/recombinase XerD